MDGFKFEGQIITTWYEFYRLQGPLYSFQRLLRW